MKSVQKDLYIKIKLKSDITMEDLQNAITALKTIGVISETASLVNKLDPVEETTSQD
jgi:hypothetical protein